MTTQKMLKEMTELQVVFDASREVAKHIYKFEGQYQLIKDYWEPQLANDGVTVVRQGFKAAAAKFNFAKPGELRTYIGEADCAEDARTLHPTLYTTDKDGNPCFGLHAEKNREDTGKLIKGRNGKMVHPFVLDRKGNVVKDEVIAPITRWSTEKIFDLLIQDQYLKAKDVIKEQLKECEAIAESKGLSMDAFVEQTTETVVKRVQAKNKENVEAKQEEAKQKRQNKRAKKNA